MNEPQNSLLPISHHHQHRTETNLMLHKLLQREVENFYDMNIFVETLK